ncbi:MAG: Amino acid ABC transporter permease protein [Candidatus Tokpelaia hoelldobleri]|uniref:Amino acid ABC transporter permease protein n=1 Tax=Candidatus Tokpelaia hoelldobleri TaxID=1902579 RepID=A0A1U9JWM4_9HYPH|nr:MAG: Amino acid ABC transporter permease protein [Candidatus Tokpelaia hoelldoblerii]
MQAVFNPDIWARYGSVFVASIWVTLLLVAVSFVAGFFLSLPVAVWRQSKNRLVRSLAGGFIYFFRGSPILAQLYLFYYGVGAFSDFWKMVHVWWLFETPLLCAILVFTLNTAAYQAEIFRAGFQSVPRSQREAGQALGLEKRVVFRRILLPQAMILTLRPLGNELILMVKASAVVALIPVMDIMGVVTKLAYPRFIDFQVYLWAAVVYLVIVEVVRRCVNIIERRLTRHMPPVQAIL